MTLGIMLMGTVSLWGADNQEAYEITLAVGLASLCLASVRRRFLWFSMATHRHADSARRFGSLLGRAHVFGFRDCPGRNVANSALYAVKVAVAVCAANGLEACSYWRGTGRPQKLAAACAR